MEEEEEEEAVVAGKSSTMSPGSESGNAPSSSGEGEALPLSMATQGSSVRPQRGGGVSREEPTPPPPVVPPTKQQYLCQPLLDAVLANIRSPVFNHSLYRTFMPAMTAIHGPSIVAPVPPPRKRKFEEDDRQTIPNVLQGEVARLNPKFLVNLDPAHCSNNGTVHLICKIDDKNLPNVPPLQLSVPADYPEQSPLWVDNRQQYEANPFLQSVHRAMMSKLLQLPDKHSVTALLQTWAQSIRQASLSAA